MSQSNANFKSKSKHPEAKEAFEKLKQALVTAPVLAYPDFSLSFTIPCDASIVAIGAVLGQVVNEKFRPVVYGSRHLTSTETRYSTTERELLAIVWASKRFNAYIYGRHVIFITDHEPLVTMRTLKEPFGRIGRLFHKIQDIDYTLIFQPGARNFTADLLSHPQIETKAVEVVINTSINWSLEQSSDNCISLIKSYIGSAIGADFTTEIVDFVEWKKVLPYLHIENEILILRDGCGDRIVVPRQLIKLVLELHHDAKFAGHRNFEKTLDSIKSRYFWVHMFRDVKSYCSTCHLCQTKKYLNHSYRAPLKPITVSEPWLLIGIDVSGPLVRTCNGNLYIILAVDYFSKFCIARATPDSTALTTARFLFEDLICRFGMFKSIISDHGKNFKSILFAQLCKLCGIKAINSTFYHPEGNGLIERTIKSTKQILTMYVDGAHQNWDVYLQAAISAYNTTKHSSIGCSPYEVIFARKPIVLADIVLSSRVNVETKPVALYVKQVKEAAASVQAKVKTQIEKAQERQKLYYDRFVQASTKFNVGDLVLLLNERSRVGQSKSFRDRTIGPFRIVEHFNDVNFKILSVYDNKTQIAHFNRLRPYRSRIDFNQPCSLVSNDIPVVSNSSQVLQREEAIIDPLRLSQLIAVFSQLSDQTQLSSASSVNVINENAFEEVSSATSVEPVVIEEASGNISQAIETSVCPVCSKEYISVAIHIGKAKDHKHKEYRALHK